MTSFFWPSLDEVRVTHPGVGTGLLFDGGIEFATALAYAIDAGHRAIAPHHRRIDAEGMTAAAREGIDVVAWTVNATDEARRLADLGVAAIITDRPGELIAESPPETET